MNEMALLNLPSRKLVWAMRVVSLVALCISSYLGWSAYQQSEVVGCGGGAVWDCGHVLHSRWSKWLGMPVSVPAAGMYVTVLIALAICGSATKLAIKHIAWAVVTVGCLSAGVAAVWFISLQVFVLKKLCVYCMCAHCCGLVLSAIILWRRPLGKKMTSALSGLSFLGACALIVGQIIAPAPKMYAEERYDEIDFSGSDGEVFAVDGIDAERNSDEFLIAPIEEMLPPTEDDSNEIPEGIQGGVTEVPTSPNITKTRTPEASKGENDLAEFVSKYSIKLANDIREMLKTDTRQQRRQSIDDLVLTNDVAPFHEIDAQRFEPVQEEKPSANKVTSQPITESIDFQRGLEEIAQDLAELSRSESLAPTKTESTASSQTQPLVITAESTNAKSAESKSIAIVGESMGVRHAAPLQSESRETAAKPVPKRRAPSKSYQFARDASILVHDVPLYSDNTKSSPTPTASPVPKDEATNSAKAETAKDKRNLVAVLGGRAKLDSRHWPLLGDTQAKYVLVELFDYTCPHCRKMNQHIQAARQRYGEDLSIMTLPVPLSQECNNTVTSTKIRHQAACELARLAVAVWRINPQAYETFHEWLFIPEHGRNTGEAWSYASQLVGNEALRAEMSKPTVNQFISKHVELYKRAGQGTVPKLMLPKVTIRGEMNSPQDLYNLLERELFTAN